MTLTEATLDAWVARCLLGDIWSVINEMDVWSNEDKPHVEDVAELCSAMKETWSDEHVQLVFSMLFRRAMVEYAIDKFFEFLSRNQGPGEDSPDQMDIPTCRWPSVRIQLGFGRHQVGEEFLETTYGVCFGSFGARGYVDIEDSSSLESKFNPFTLGWPETFDEATWSTFLEEVWELGKKAMATAFERGWRKCPDCGAHYGPFPQWEHTLCP